MSAWNRNGPSLEPASFGSAHSSVFGLTELVFWWLDLASQNELLKLYKFPKKWAKLFEFSRLLHWRNDFFQLGIHFNIFWFQILGQNLRNLGLKMILLIFLNNILMARFGSSWYFYSSARLGLAWLEPEFFSKHSGWNFSGSVHP